MKLIESKFLIDNKSKMKQLVAILSKTYDYVSILGTDVTGTTYIVKTSGNNLKPSGDSERGFVVRVFQNGLVSEYSFNQLNVDTVVKRINEIARTNRALISSEDNSIIYRACPSDEPLTMHYVAEVDHLPENQNPQAIIKKMQTIHDDVKVKYAQLVDLSMAMYTTQVNKLFISANRDLYQSYLYANTYAVATASNDKKTENEHRSTSGLMGDEILDELYIIADTASESACELLTAEKIEPGLYDIICDPDFTGLIAHEAFGHGAEMDMFVKDRAKGKDFMNLRVASDNVFMHDGAKAYGEVSSYQFDDEGNLGTDTLIINQGILEKGMNDTLTALKLGLKPTGNGKRESYKRKAYTRMTNTFFDKGDDTLEDMIASIDRGYLLIGFSSGMEDPKNWGIQCVAAKAREIVGGKITDKVVSPVYLTGYVPDLLESITMVSNDLVLNGSGYCGKGWKEWVKTSTGGGYIKAKGRLS